MTKGPVPRPVTERVWQFVPTDLASDVCWPWQGSMRSGVAGGYGQMWEMTEKGKRLRLAHRIVFRAVHGYLPPVVRHTCDNPPCVNPRHLLPGTAIDNVRDMVERRGHTGSGRGKHWTDCPADGSCRCYELKRGPRGSRPYRHFARLPTRY